MLKRDMGLYTVLVLLIGVGAIARADVLGYTTKTDDNGTVLTSVTVKRGKSAVIFDPAKLIRARVTYFRSSGGATVAATPGTAAPKAGQRAEVLRDLHLDTGLLNPGGQDKPLTSSPVLAWNNATPGMAVRFDQPVENLRGDDVVLFELHRLLNSPVEGDAFYVSPLQFRDGLRTLTVDGFDIDLDHKKVLPLPGFDLHGFRGTPQSLADVERLPLGKRNAAPLTDFHILAVGIDLSDLGYAEGEKVQALFFQDKSGRGLMVDPVLIAGLPSPKAPNVLAAEPKIIKPAPPHEKSLQEFLDGPLADVKEIVFAVRVCGFDHWYANFGRYAAHVSEYPPQCGVEGKEIRPCFGEGGRLCRLNLRTGELTVLLEDAKGGIRDPQVHYGGKKLLFSYRKGGEDEYHLYEINVDGSGLTQLTDGAYDDIEPAYLPDGGIMFCSSRCKRFVNCHRTPVATLHRCDGDGKNVRMVSPNIEHDNTPWVLHDGRVMYMRWEYVDRSQFAFHHLWTTNPDGTGQMVFFGNQRRGTAMLDAKPIPGSDKVVASFSPGHGVPGHMGYVTVVDPDLGPDRDVAARKISRGRTLYRDPYAISEDCFLAADKEGIKVMDGTGHTQPLYRLPKGVKRLSCHEPRPLRARKREPTLVPRVDLSKATGRLILADVCHGRNMLGVKRGEIKKLLVLEQLPKPINFSGGMWPISVGGTFTLARILGTVPVESDGSAYMELPAMRSVFFVALDADDLSVKRMQSFLTVQPGETTGCVGCHEQRSNTPVYSPDLFATARPPSRIEPIDDVPEVMDFPRDVQPILDKHCVECHRADRRDGNIDLTGDHTPLFAESYWGIMHQGLISDGRNQAYGNRPPRSIGSSASRLMKLIDGTHYDAELSPLEQKTVRLWIESSAVYAGTYAALGSGMCPVEFPVEVMEQRCGTCHGSEPPKGKRKIGKGKLYFRFGKKGPALPLVHRFGNLQRIRGGIGYYKFGNARPPQSLCNLTHPEKSLLLRAPLSSDAGGLGLCSPTVFANTKDADYKKILAHIVAASETHRKEKRFDMPGFRPNIYYIRMMQRYGILPKDLAPDAPVDCYATDRTYWQSLWYRPVKVQSAKRKAR